MQRAIISFFIAISTATALANDGWANSTGGAEPYGKKHPHIQMVSEHVRIDMQDEYALVNVDFNFKNHGNATTVTMAFPDEWSDNAEPGVTKFRTWVDGKEVRAKKKALPFNEEEDYMRKAVWLKDVTFARGGKRLVKVSYRANYSGINTGDRFFTYVLKTGATWRDKIDQSKITIDWTKMKKLSKPDLQIYDAKTMWRAIGRHKREIVLRDFEPTSDLEIAMVPGFWNVILNGSKVPAAAAAGSYTPVLHGSHSDPMIKVDKICDFFGAPSKGDAPASWKSWSHPVVPHIGGEFEISKNALRFTSGKKLELPSATREVSVDTLGEPVQYVRLKDLVRTLGGTFRYVSADDRIEIAFPKVQPKPKRQTI